MFLSKSGPWRSNSLRNGLEFSLWKWGISWRKIGGFSMDFNHETLGFNLWMMDLGWLFCVCLKIFSWAFIVTPGLGGLIYPRSSEATYIVCIYIGCFWTPGIYIPYHIISYYIISYHVILCCIISYHIIFYSIVYFIYIYISICNIYIINIHIYIYKCHCRISLGFKLKGLSPTWAQL